ncbi:MAG: NAD-dependent deacylase [Synergistaceae bacterium]|nr:NAD-dependent deacylase [Synergistaceae bacterium]
MSFDDKAREVASLVRAGGVVIFSGAGLSTESGLLDFRSKDGIWAHADPTRLASVGALENNYDEFLEFYKARLFVPDEVLPNVGHKIIAGWEKRGYVDGVITQNVDRLHQRAGSEKVWELHGSLEPVYCHSCGKMGERGDFLAGKPCSACGGHLRPSVVLFGEMLPQNALEAADELSDNCRTFIVLGSSLVVSPANYFPRQAKMRGAKLVIVNREPTPLDGIADVAAHEGIGEFLSAAERYMG